MFASSGHTAAPNKISAKLVRASAGASGEDRRRMETTCQIYQCGAGITDKAMVTSRMRSTSTPSASTYVRIGSSAFCFSVCKMFCATVVPQQIDLPGGDQID